MPFPNPPARQLDESGSTEAPERPAMTTPLRLLEESAPYVARLVGLAVRRGSCPHSARDIASETLLRAATAGKPFDGDPWPYLATIAINIIRDEARRTARDEQLARRADLRRSDAIRFESNVEDGDVAVRLLAELRATEPSITVSMIVRRAQHGLSWEELGREFAMSAAAAQSRLHRAYSRLRRRLGTAGRRALA